MKKLLSITLIALLLLSHLSTTAHAQSTQNQQVQYFDDGSYLITTISDENANINLRSTSLTKTKTKTSEYYNSSGKVLYMIAVTGTFTYDGTTSNCVLSKANAQSYNNNWKIGNMSSTKSSNTATAIITIKHYKNDTLIDTLKKRISLTCSPSGKFS